MVKHVVKKIPVITRKAGLLLLKLSFREMIGKSPNENVNFLNWLLLVSN
jgi:hypothetical protein